MRLAKVDKPLDLYWVGSFPALEVSCRALASDLVALGVIDGVPLAAEVVEIEILDHLIGCKLSAIVLAKPVRRAGKQKQSCDFHF